MRVTYLHQYFNTPSMTGGTRSYEMAKRLVALGHEVNIVTSWRNEDGRSEWFETNEDGINVHWLPIPYSNHMSYGARIWAFLKFAIFSARRAASLEADVVFATSTPLTIALPAVYCARKRKRPLVFEVRDLWPELPIAIGAISNPVVKIFAKSLERWAYRNSEAVVALSPGMKDGVCRAGYEEGRVAVIPNSSDNKEFSVGVSAGREFRNARPWLGERPLLIYPGTFGKINGVGYLVDLAKELLFVAPDVRILLIGDGAERNLVREKAEALGVLNVNLFMEPNVSKSGMPAVFSAADMICSLFVDMPEMRANSANKFFDALAASKGLLLNYGGWQAELVEKAQCGIVTWGMPLNESARCVAEKLQNKAWLSGAGLQSKKMASFLFDRDVLAGQLERVLIESCGRRGGGVSKIAPGVFDLATAEGSGVPA